MFVARTLERISDVLHDGEPGPALSGGRGQEHLRLRTLVMLRWLAVFGQTVMVLLVAYGLGFHIRLGLSLGIIMASVWLNITLSLGRRSVTRVRGWEAALQLSFDACQLALLLGVTGGLDNPFCLMLIAPPTVAAANLPTRHGLAVVVVSIIAACGLAFWSLDLPWFAGETFTLPHMYRSGFLAAIIVGIVFTAGYAWQTALEQARMARALTATQAVLAKEHRLSALGGLAAAAAHELGTPLGTIQVVAREMLNGLKPGDALFEDAELLVSQSQRCRDILKSLSASPERSDMVYERMALRSFLEEAAAPYRAAHKQIVISVSVEGAPAGVDPGLGMTIRRRPEWLHAFSAFIENAVDFARTTVYVRAEVTRGFVSVTIEDDGPGFAPDILSRLGDPYVSSRYQAEIAENRDEASHSGMGLGFFIAKTLIEYTDATVSFGNREAGGAHVRALWRREQIDILPADSLIL
ncbi:ActS/PrrB/RegB family redox-sensitive histidine kinase [Asticcacaulis sp. EMRT-3]|uniref:ActS/PrrB/RegB family redox-sensitive histidine kinase n=1 Tax=Asticcacaulis sp. EMRT-3 TaxID=3040349 RepID=UPI0024AF1AE0|nr:ActS/PrrB/RegB family redox-sensitive histidine kinase [Asticcacaulis sp. EMRT-3]MDI7775989.1 ActS/PrrB/RegB family redox-sensitive histidine kinase [Asticcacaulis sp. EMRT-3]